MAARGYLGSRAPCPAHGRPRACRARGEPDGSDPGQPVRENGGSKRGSKGFDAGKKVKGRKRHILTDTDGRLLAIQVHGADIQDRDGAKGVLKRSRALFPFVEHAYGDGGYAGRLVRWAKRKAHIVLEIVKRSPTQTGFAVIRRRWVIERTFAWIMKNRRLVRDYEQLTAVAETLITIAATATLIRRWP
jgi:transposase